MILRLIRLAPSNRLTIKNLACFYSTASADTAASKPNAPISNLSNLPLSPELQPLLHQLSSLTLLQTAQLVTALRTHLNLPEITAAPVQMAAPTSAPVVEEAKPAKTEFRLTLEGFEATSKAKVIKEIKGLLPQLNLVEAKAFVEGAPKLIKEKLKKEEAEKLKATLEAVGAKVSME